MKFLLALLLLFATTIFAASLDSSKYDEDETTKRLLSEVRTLVAPQIATCLYIGKSIKESTACFLQLISQITAAIPDEIVRGEVLMEVQNLAVKITNGFTNLSKRTAETIQTTCPANDPICEQKVLEESKMAAAAFANNIANEMHHIARDLGISEEEPLSEAFAKLDAVILEDMMQKC